MPPQAKNILLGITGGIAAYKSPYLVRLLIKSGFEVKVIMTPSAKNFVTPVTLSTVSKNPVHCNFFNSETGEWVNHVELSEWADLFIIAPATSSTLSKMANANSDNLLIATYLSATCPVWVFPAMDRDMYQNPANKHNLDLLAKYGVKVFPSPSGELASGLNGEGRMMEPEHICQAVLNHFDKKKDFEGKKVLITAGPTYEKLDPVRFIGNYSSGKMGFELAHSLEQRGAEVCIVHGPVSIACPSNVKTIPVESAQEMLQHCQNLISDCDIFIGAAAVADYRPIVQNENKIKKSDERLTLELVKNPDIISELAKLKKDNQIFVGFALETNNEIQNAQEKIKKKGLDFIVLNSLNDPGAGFKFDTNKISIIDRYNKITNFELKTKSEVATDICNYLSTLINQ